MTAKTDHHGLPRAEHVGSLLRRPRLKAAIDSTYAPGHTSLLEHERGQDLRALHDAEDEAVREVVARQENLGFDLVADGEQRRMLFLNSLYDAVSGIGAPDEPIPYPDPAGQGEVIYYPGIPRVVGQIERIDNPACREAEFLAAITSHRFKVGFPAGSWCPGPFGYHTDAQAAYPDQDAFMADLHSIQRELMSEVIEARADHLQFDFPPYVVVGDESWRRRLEARGLDCEAMVDRCLQADRDIVSDLPSHVTTALHVCRGNYRSRWIWEGSLEPVAERLFALPYQRFLVEWEDTSREGDYSALRSVPPGPAVVLGLVSSKNPQVETIDDLLRRVDEASQYLPIEQLGIAPQCGFASSAPGNNLDEDTQWQKLERLQEVAELVWGR